MRDARATKVALSDADARLCEDVVARLDEAACEWDSVCAALEQFRESLTDAVLEEVVRRSARKLGFWPPDEDLTGAARSAIRRRLDLSTAKGGAEGEEAAPAAKAVKADAPAEEKPAEAAPAAEEKLAEATLAAEEGSKGLDAFADALATSHTRRVSRNEYNMFRQISEMSGLTTGTSRRKSESRGCPSEGGRRPSGFLDFGSLLPGMPSNDDAPRRPSNVSNHLGKSGSLQLCRSDLMTEVSGELPAAQGKAEELAKKGMLSTTNPAASKLRQFKCVLLFFVTFQMVLFAIFPFFYTTPTTWDIIGLPILIAKGSAYGACFWTGVLFLTMSRDLISFVSRVPCIRDSQWAVQMINCHKELHVFSAFQLLLNSCLHALMHHIGTFVALEKEDAATLNKMLVCAQPNSGNLLEAFQYPACPLPENAEVGYLDGVLSTPCITGYLLMAVIFALGWFSRQKARRADFRLFYALHHLLVPTWVALNILHGANNWVGLGFPLVLLVAGVPVAAYLWTRLRRAYLTFRHDAKVLHARKSASGKLLRLEVELMPSYRTCKVGEYAYLNVQELGRTEWHPFTISDAKRQPDGRQVLQFCIMSVGTWTKKLHELFDPMAKAARLAWQDGAQTAQNAGDRPKVYVDGPFYAPTVGISNRSTVVGIGAGVGVTPFLSFLGSLTGDSGARHRNAHVFWMSAFASDFMLFKDMFSALDARAKTQADNTTTFHLHATPRFGAWDGKGLGGVFELAARDVWADWERRLLARGAGLVPSFCCYGQPLHAVVSRNMLESERPLAVAVGSPDWIVELLAIGQADPSEDVFVYFCGNPFLQNLVQKACIACNEVRMSTGKDQRYYFYFERFG